MKSVLTIAGSDTIGGAGIQADLKTCAAFGVYGMSVITALTAQNTMGVTAIHQVPPEFVTAQLDAVFADIVPDAVKIGMVSNPEIIRAIAGSLRHYAPKQIVVDPVMIATSGSRLLLPEAQAILVEELLPLATVITPNLPEAETLAGRTITSAKEMEEAAAQIADGIPGAVLLKGGHFDGNANDLLWCNGAPKWFPGERLDTTNTHGTGCTLSSAIACGLAQGLSVEAAVAAGKEYITGALRHDPHLGKGNGPLDHAWRQRNSQ